MTAENSLMPNMPRLEILQREKNKNMISNETEGHFHAHDENAGDNGV